MADVRIKPIVMPKWGSRPRAGPVNELILAHIGA